MEQGEHRKKKRAVRKAAALFLAFVLTISPCIAWLPGGALAEEAGFTVEKLDSNHMFTDLDFPFFGSRMGSGIYYWMKSDGSPLFCVQKRAQLTYGVKGEENGEPIGECEYFTREQYEMASIILQCCGMKKEEDGTLEPGAYLAGQAAVWGIQSNRYTGPDQLKEEMETLHEHVKDWHGLTAEEIVSQSREMVERICQALKDYCGDQSPYIPAFASKYEEKAPVHKAQWQKDGSCEAVFSLGDKDGSVKEFIYQLPEGWNVRWDEDQIVFCCQEPEPGVVSIVGTAPENSPLGLAMPVGLIYIVGIIGYPSLQHLASCVEISLPWSCYFKISVPEKPEEGSWYLPETEYYRHKEDFKAVYGVNLEKTDGDSGEVLTGVGFQVLEYFDAGQLEDTILDKEQFAVWNGWKALCSEETTDSSGQIGHTDQKEYHFETTYCTGHPDPEILYEGDSEEFRRQLEEEAWQAWEEEVEACSRLCDWHAVDGDGKEKARQQRDLAYEQFTHLAYGYTFRETKPLEGYWPLEEDPDGKEIERIFCESVQAGGRFWKEEAWKQSQTLPERSAYLVSRVMAASKSSAKREGEENPALQETVSAKEKSADESIKTGAKPKIRVSGSDVRGILPAASGEKAILLSEIDEEEERLSTPSEAKKKKKTRKTSPVWLTSSIELLEQGKGDEVDYKIIYMFYVENHKPEIPEETTPEETTPEETLPEETTPEETTSEETLPEETTPEETLPEETTPEETTPEETLPEETIPEETLPEETMPEETTPEETLPEETTPEETTPEETLPKETTPEETLPEETTPEETLPEETMPEETLPEETAPEETQPKDETPAIPEESVPKETPPRQPPGSDGGGGNRPPASPAPARPQVMETQPAESILPEEIPQGGWIGARYTLPVVLDENGVPLAVREGRSLKLPKTGDQQAGYGFLIGIMAGSGLLALCRYWRKKKKGKENRICRGILSWFLLPVLLSISALLNVYAEENVPAKGNVPAVQGDWIIYVPAEEGEEFTPSWHYTDEEGQEYELVSCRLTEQEQPKREEEVRKIYTFEGLEGQVRIPEEITFPFREMGENEEAVGRLKQAQVLEVSQHWEDGFVVPITFYGYGSDYYDFQEAQIPKNGELTFLFENQHLILAEIGCSQDQYQIDGIVWDGESYRDQGISCRNALALGRKLLTDYVVAYEGVLQYPETRDMVWEVIYRPGAGNLSGPEQDLKPERESVPVIEGTVPPKESSVQEPKSMDAVWKLFRTLAIYSVSLAAFIPVLVYLVLLFRKKKQTLPGK